MDGGSAGVIARPRCAHHHASRPVCRLSNGRHPAVRARLPLDELLERRGVVGHLRHLVRDRHLGTHLDDFRLDIADAPGGRARTIVDELHYLARPGSRSPTSSHACSLRGRPGVVSSPRHRRDVKDLVLEILALAPPALPSD